MMVYIDSDFRCHVVDDGTMTAVESEFFDGKCQEYIEGYRFVPSGESWMREDGAVFKGKMIAPWKPYEELDMAQRKYEQERLANAEEALAILMGEVS